MRAASITTQTAGDATIVVEDGTGSRILRVVSRSGDRLEIGSVNENVVGSRILAYPRVSGGRVLVWAHVRLWCDRLTLIDRIGNLDDE